MNEHAIIRPLLTRHPMLKILFLLALLFDTLSTIYFMQLIGPTHEIHPLVRYAALTCGPVIGTFIAGFAFKIIVSFTLEAMYLKQYAAYLYAAVVCTSTFAGFYNLTVVV